MIQPNSIDAKSRGAAGGAIADAGSSGGGMLSVDVLLTLLPVVLARFRFFCGAALGLPADLVLPRFEVEVESDATAS